MRALIATLALLAWRPAGAQEVDGHGEIPPAFDPSPRAPLTVQAPWSAPQGSWSALGLFEVVDAPLVRYVQTGPDAAREEVILDDVVALNLAGRYALLDRFGLAAVVPVFLGTAGEVGGGPALGDVRLWAPVGLVLPEPSGKGFGLSAVPWASLPTGANERLLGDPGFGFGLDVVTGVGLGAVSGDLNLGLGRSAPEVLDNAQQLGGGFIGLGLGLGLHPTETWGLHLEGRVQAATSDAAAVADTPGDIGATVGSPAELLLTFKTRLPGKAWGTAGLGRATNNGYGAARFRGFLGVGVASAVPGEEGPELVPFALKVVDPSGVPVVGAQVLFADKEVGVTGGDGVLSLEDPKWRKGVEVQATHHVPTAVSEPEVGATSMEVVLPYEPYALSVRVQDQQGQKVDAVLRATNLDDPEPSAVTGPPGGLKLVPGRWRIEVVAEGFGTQARTVAVAPGAPPEELEVVLLEDMGPAVLSVNLVDPQRDPVEGARVLVDGQPIGTSGAGGLVEVAGLAAGPHAVAVLHENFTRLEEPELELVDGANPYELVLRRVPGSVKVLARGPGGAVVPDAVVRFDGPRRLPPAPLGGRGERIQVLGPGDWTLIVTSAEYGVQQRTIAVPEASYELITVEVVLQPGEQGEASLSLRVVDADGLPVRGAQVQLDGKKLGSTSTGGAVKLVGLQSGPRELTVSGERFRERPAEELFLVDGLQEHVVTLDWKAGTVLVTARHPTGPVDDLVLRWIGTETLPPAPLGPMGESHFQLDAGTWTALGTSQRWGLQQAVVSIPEDSRSLHRVDLMMRPDEGGLADLDLKVVDPLGGPVVGASVLLDGAAVGSTTNTGELSLKHLSVGPRAFDVRAPLFAPATERLRLGQGEQTREIALDWAPGATRIAVRSNGAPVTDAVVRLIGPTSVAPAPVDGSGQRLFSLTPGTWQALAISSAAGIGQGTVEIAADASGLTELTVDIAPGAVGSSTLLVRVMDPDGRPVTGAEIQLDGDVVGETGPGGALLVEGLPPGLSAITAMHPEMAALAAPVRTKLVEGSTERIVELDYKPGAVVVVATDPSGAPVDARVQLVGAVDAEPVQLGADGEERIPLRPGSWQVIASTDALGPARADVTVLAGRPQRVELVLNPTRVAMTGEAVVIKEQVQFDFGKATLRKDSDAILDEVANAILGNPGIIRVEVQGHTDAIGEVAYNQTLSQQRAEAVLAALVARDVPPEKVVARGYGNQRPVASNDTEEGRAENRRVEFDIVEQAGAAE